MFRKYNHIFIWLGLIFPKNVSPFLLWSSSYHCTILLSVRVHIVWRMLNAIVAEEDGTYNRYLDIILITWKNHPHADQPIQKYVQNTIR